MGWFTARPARNQSRPTPTGTGGYTPPVYAERGYESSATGFVNNPNVLVVEGMDYYGSPHNDQPFSVAWQGVQKVNAATDLAGASVHVGYSPAIGAGLPEQSWTGAGLAVDSNPLQSVSPHSNGLVRLFADGGSSVGTFGPGTWWAPNPTAIGSGDSGAYAPQPVPAQGSLLNSIRRKIGL